MVRAGTRNFTVFVPILVGDCALMGAGAVVISDIPAGATAVGVPARVVHADVPEPQFA